MLAADQGYVDLITAQKCVDTAEGVSAAGQSYFLRLVRFTGGVAISFAATSASAFVANKTGSHLSAAKEYRPHDSLRDGSS